LPETVTALRRRGYRTAICTNKQQGATIMAIYSLDLLPLLDGIAGGDHFPLKKPDAGRLLGRLPNLEVGFGTRAMIADNENDAAAARITLAPLELMRYS
jgi:phosphoglycolate phosphatase